MAVLRAFLAHPKSLERDDELEALRQRTTFVVQEHINRFGGNRTAEVVTGRDDYNARVLAAGGWDAWADSVSTFESLREDQRFRPFYDLIVVSPHAVVGKGTARIVHSALARSFPVFFLPERAFGEMQDTLHSVCEVIVTDGANFQSGFALRYRPLEQSG